jgi:cytochrome c oxidase assembly factor CtaG
MPPMNSVPGWGSWSFDPLAILTLLAASYVYARMYRRARTATRGGRAHSLGAGHWLPYSAGIATLAIALLSPIDAIGDGWLLSAHMLQHVLLADVAPALIVLGLRSPVLPLGLAPVALRQVAPGGRGGRALGLVTSPWVAIPLWALATWVWALPAAFDFAAQHGAVHALEHATLFYTGLALWWLIVDPLPRGHLRPGGQRLALLGFTRIASAVICVPLTWMTTVQYPLYASAPRDFGLSALADQQLAGAGMCFIEFLVFGIAFAAVFISVLSRDEARVSVTERAAAR